jgi:hypothetical protein
LRAGFALPEDFPVAAKPLAGAGGLSARGNQRHLDKRNNSVNVWDTHNRPADPDASGAFVTEVQLDPSRAELHNTIYNAKGQAAPT